MMIFIDKYRYSTPPPAIVNVLFCISFFYDNGRALANRLIQTRLKAVGKTNFPAQTRGVMRSCVSVALLLLLAALRSENFPRYNYVMGLCVPF